MCGIVGMAGNIKPVHKKMFRDMLLFDVVRGMDSTGVVSVGPNEGDFPEIVKDLGHPLNLFDQHFYEKNSMFSDRGILKGNSKFLLGHNRAATVGKVTVDNAHPFTFGDITGVHNGSLVNTYNLEGNFDVDSKDLYYTIHKKGIEHAWKNMQGAAALVWWDEGKETFSIVRNSERPLYYAFNKEKDVIFWASEQWMILVAAGRDGTNVSLAQNEKGETIMPKMFPTHTLYTYKPTKNSIECEGTTTLEKWVAPTNNFGGRYPIGFARGTIVDKPDNHKINDGWAKGKDKGDKEFRGKQATFTYSANTYEGPKGHYYIVGEVHGTKERIVAYPPNVGEWKRWRDMVLDKDKVVVKIRHRPRYKPWAGKKIELSVSTTSLDIVRTEKYKSNVTPFPVKEENNEEDKSFRGPGGVLLDEKSFQTKLKLAGGCCAWCNQTIEQEDHEELWWPVEGTVLCGECAKEDYVQNLVGM